MAPMRILLLEARVGFHKQGAQKCAYKKALLTINFLTFLDHASDKICIVIE